MLLSAADNVFLDADAYLLEMQLLIYAACSILKDIFNQRKLEDIVPSSHNSEVPHVKRTDYQLMDITDDGYVGLLTDSGDMRDDLKLPTHDDELVSRIKADFAAGKDLVVTVLSAMGEEQINAIKDITTKT